jgi:signal transduction histidine kinase
VTDARRQVQPGWAPVLRDAARASGHELRNALNGLVVNLEVVRSRSGSLDASAQPFFSQALDQAEESARLAESAIALLNMIVTAIGESGELRARQTAPGTVELEVTEEEAGRAVQNLAALSKRTSLTIDASGGTVILSVPERTSDSSGKE